MNLRRDMTNALLATLCACTAANALPPDLAMTQFATGLTYPLAIAAPHDGSGRIFVVQQTGAIKVLSKTGAALGTYFTVPVSAPSPDGGEQGLLGLAFDPNFGKNAAQPGFADFYVAFTAPSADPRLGSSQDQVVRRYTVTDPASNSAGAAVGADVIHIPDIASNHNGGDIHFGPDGYLYYSMGDGGVQNDTNNFAQDLWKKVVSTKTYYLLGKLLRLDVHGTTPQPYPVNMCGAPASGVAQYAIPSSNPYSDATANPQKCAEIMYYGFRNPFRFSFDSDNGDLWVGDVGQNTWEEVDYRTADSVESINYGWNTCEGTHLRGSSSACNFAGSVLPVLDYGHGVGQSVSGGVRFRGPIQQFRGVYVYSDSANSKVFFATGSGATWNSTLFQTVGSGSYGIVGFGEDESQNLYAAHISDGIIYKFTSDYIYQDGFQ